MNRTAVKKSVQNRTEGSEGVHIRVQGRIYMKNPPNLSVHPQIEKSSSPVHPPLNHICLPPSSSHHLISSHPRSPQRWPRLRPSSPVLCHWDHPTQLTYPLDPISIISQRRIFRQVPPPIGAAPNPTAPSIPKRSPHVLTPLSSPTCPALLITTPLPPALLAYHNPR